MQKYISLFFSVLLFLTACSDEELPKDVLDERAMISVLTDVHLTDGTIYTVPQVPDSMYKYAYAKFALVFKRHHTTSAVFKNSLKYYSKRPEQIQEIYDKVETSIKGKLDSVNKPGIKPAAQGTGSKAPARVRPLDTVSASVPGSQSAPKPQPHGGSLLHKKPTPHLKTIK